ncbi:BICD family-like cargo adapter 2 [Hyperolius riggenbachi]|uniref:BICD family-like cargo adapter 2 n=1 Tax=Hyperolius riggenbachi TaxID=752182 RepID=UPI0035A2AA3C
MTSGEAENHAGVLRGWNGNLPSPSMEEDFYPFLLERRTSYLGEDEEVQVEEDLNLVLEQKDKDLLLAAELGKALLERNEHLERVREALEEELRETHERLEQEKHALRQKMEMLEIERKAQITDLESDLAETRLQMKQLMSEQRECGRESATAVHELSEQNQRLMEQLAQASQAEQSLNLQLHSLREENRDLNLSRGHFAPCLQSLQSENALLLEKKKEMESRMKQQREEYENSQNILFTLKETVLQLERQKSEAEARLQEAQAEVQHLRDGQRSLQTQIRDLQDELKLRDSHCLQDNSLHSEMWESAATQDSLDGPVLLSSTPVGQTKRVPDSAGHMATYLPQRERDLLREKEEEVSKLQDQVTLQFVEINNLREELQRLRDMSQHNDRDSLLKQAISDRDEAFMKKGELELELAKARLEKESMSRQLLSAVEQKVLLSQELEAWQDDMQIVISQQLKSQREQETQRATESSPSTLIRRGSSRRVRDTGSGILSFFKRI